MRLVQHQQVGILCREVQHRSAYSDALSFPMDSTAMKASCGTSTRPSVFMRFLPAACAIGIGTAMSHRPATQTVWSM